MGVLNSGEYANDSFVATAHRPADPKVQARIKELVEQARSLEEKRLAANAKDVDALYARGVTRGQLSTYTALVERSWYAALKSAVGARNDHEQVLELSPDYTDAKLIVGAHNYVLGSLPWGVKILVKVIGQGGNKDKGIRYLREAAAGSGETSTDAKIVLLLFLRREHKYPEALEIADALVPQYPQNLLIALEQGNLLRASGRNSEAASAYQRILQSGRDGLYPDLHYELAALSLGDLLRAQKDYAGAASAYEQVNQIQKPDPERGVPTGITNPELFGPAERILHRGRKPMYCNYCGKVIQDDAHLCAYCGTRVGGVIGRKRLLRSRTNRKIAGVCAGFAEYFDLDVTLVRVLWLILLFWPPCIGLVSYLIAWIVMPEEPEMHPVPVGQQQVTNP